MTKYNRMTLQEREKIYILLQTNHNKTFIAKQLGRNKSSISRELARCNSDPIGYIPDRGQKISESFLRRNPKIFRSKKLLDSVVSFLKEGWSPEQITGRLKLENNGISILSHETIYQFIYSPEGQAQRLYLLLTRQKPKRTKWFSRKPRRSHIPESANIINRPKSIDNRKKVGHLRR